MTRREGTLRILTLTVLAMALPLLASDHGVIRPYTLDAESMQQWRLPNRLKEISGLALTGNGRLLAMDDEIAVVYEIDYDEGGLVKAFAFGNPAVEADFEGIAVMDGLVYLVTSNGRVYLAAEGGDGQRVTFDNFNTGLGDLCEIEGLVGHSDGDTLFMLCKAVRDPDKLDSLMIFAWSVSERQLLEQRSIELPERDILRALGMDRINPSGLALDPNTGHFVLVAARQRALVEVDGDGNLVAAKVLPLALRHRQAEGVELADRERLLISDEGGSHRARLAVYYPHAIENKDND